MTIIHEVSTIETIIQKSMVCRLALCKDNEPYLVPVCFGYTANKIYVHTSTSGQSVDFIKANPRASFEFENDVKLVPHPDQACHFSMSYESVIGSGTIQEITDMQEKEWALNLITHQYTQLQLDMDNSFLNQTRVWCIEIDVMTAKRK
jgi:nitroimidazol reductase NimA-like FMN-containing flavoprotein (pyridoxamine 5'-phosphate oxidase superfamily)